MIAVDTNVLVQAHREESPKHRAALKRLELLSGGPAPWGVPVFCIGEFLRVVTHPRPFDPPHTALEAYGALAQLLSLENAVVLRPGPDYPARLMDAVREVDAVGNLIFDAQIVALCRECGVTALLTEDRDFDRFGDLHVERLTL